MKKKNLINSWMKKTMIWCYIYRSTKRDNCYLYVDKENDFTKVPETLIKAFGQPILCMKIFLDEKRKLVAGSAQEIEEKIKNDGFFLHMLNEDDFYVATN